MKVKTTIRLSREILRKVDRCAGGANNRSSFIELAVRTYMDLLKRYKRDQRDLGIIDQLSETLNREAIDVLQYQVDT